MALTPNAEHVDQGVAKLLDQFRSQPGIVAILSAWLEQVQTFEDDAQDVAAGLNVDSASGYQLDVLGILVGEERQNLTDAQYRVRIKSRIGINISNGHADELLRIMTATLGTVVTMQEYAPAAFELYSVITNGNLLDEVAGVLRALRPAGVKGQLTYAGTTAFPIFQYDGAAGTGYDGTATYRQTIE